MKKRSVLFLTLLYSCLLYTQQKTDTITSNKQALQEVISTLKKTFEISISYNSKIVENKQVVFLNEYTSLGEAIKDIEQQSGLFFKEINTSNYILQNNRASKNKIGICGFLKDAKSNAAIPNAEIMIDSILKTKSDERGYFELIEIPENKGFWVSFYGCVKEYFHLDDLDTSQCGSIYLDVACVTSLEEVVIQDYFGSGFSKTGNGAVRILPKKIRILPGLSRSDVMQGLQLIPGIQSPDETNTGLNVRGGTPDQNLILWDGIKLYQNDHFFGMLSAINSSMVDQINLYRNGASAKYGNHLSSVIDISSEERIPEDFSGGGGVNMIHGDLFFKAPVSDRVGVFFSARRSYSDLLETITFDKFSEHIFQNTRIKENDTEFDDFLSKTNNDFYFTDVMTKILIDFSDKSSLSISSLYFRNNLNFLSQFEEINRFTEDRLDIVNKGVNIGWDHSWNTNFITDININYSDYDFSFEGKETLFDFFDRQIIKENQILDVQLDVQSTYRWNASRQLINGISVTYNDVYFKIASSSDVVFDNDFLIASDDRTNLTYSLYNEYVFHIDRFRFQAGMRTDYFDNLSKIYLQPRIAISSQFDMGFNFNLAAEIQYQPISQITEFETRDFGLENQIWVFSDNKSNPILKSNQISFGSTYKANSWFVELETYYKKIENISSLTRGFSQDTNDFSIGESTIVGVDMMLKKRWGDYFATYLSYSLTENKFKFPDLNNGEQFSGNFDIRHYLGLTQFFRYKDFQLGMSWKLRTSKPYTPANGLSGDNGEDIMINYGAINSQRLDYYHRLDISAEYTIRKFLNDTMSLSISGSLINVYNNNSILDRNYRIILDTGNGTFNLREIDKFSIKRVPNFSLSLRF